MQNLLYEVERRIEIEWAPETAESYSVRLTIQAADRPGLLKEMTTVIADNQSNIRRTEARSEPGEPARIELTCDVTGVEQLERIVAGLKKVRGVSSVVRLPRL